MIDWAAAAAAAAAAEPAMRGRVLVLTVAAALLLLPAASAIKGDTPAAYRVHKKRGPPKWPGISNVATDNGELPMSVRSILFSCVQPSASGASRCVDAESPTTCRLSPAVTRSVGVRFGLGCAKAPPRAAAGKASWWISCRIQRSVLAVS
eukprot:SAG31_NODE_3732_length_3940_cov_35.007550_5_plen_150_part_00